MEDKTKNYLYEAFKTAVKPINFEIDPSEWLLLIDIHQFFCSNPEQEKIKDELYYVYFFNLFLADYRNPANLYKSITLLNNTMNNNQHDLSSFQHLTRFLLHLFKGKKILHPDLLNALPLSDLKTQLFTLPTFEPLISYLSESSAKNSLLDELLFELWTAKDLTEISAALNNEQRNFFISANKVPQIIPKDSIIYKFCEGYMGVFHKKPSIMGQKLTAWLEMANQLLTENQLLLVDDSKCSSIGFESL